MKKLVEKINAEIADFQVNAEAQLVKGNKAAGARARKAALALMKDLKEFRAVSVADAKKSFAKFQNNLATFLKPSASILQV